MTAEGDHWSIGEVLSLLQDEFPEITISKIRFLESQGLIQPERTPSGYRRFFQHDFDLLHWILVQQRDHYLPLKVIRDRIQSGEVEQGLLDFSDGSGSGPLADPPTPADSSGSAAASTNGTSSNGSSASAEPKAKQKSKSKRRSEAKAAASAAESSAAAPQASSETPPTPATDPTSAASDATDDAVSPGAGADAPSESPTRVPDLSAGTPPPVRPASAVVEPAEPLPPLALTKDELAESSGCSVKMIGDLERYGLVKGRKAGPAVLYDNTALLISRIAAQFDTFGLEPRHLRTFLIGAEREMGLVHQVVEPMLHRRDEETRRKAHETLDDLTDLAGSLRSILMRQAAEELLPKH